VLGDTDARRIALYQGTPLGVPNAVSAKSLRAFRP
jgi:hypothetical protein